MQILPSGKWDGRVQQICAWQTIQEVPQPQPMIASIDITGMPWELLASPASCHVAPLVSFLRSNNDTDQPALAE